MKVIVDTDVWSEALRKPNAELSKHVLILQELIQDGRVQMIGPIRQEILSGIRQPERYVQFREILRAFQDASLETVLFEQAANHMNLLRGNGIQASATDVLICACSLEWKMPILSKDQDYQHYQKYLPLQLLIS
jgi:predicted nucleic acid-binding protein